MARTLSVPGGSDCASLAAGLTWRKTPLGLPIRLGLPDPHRVLLSIVAIALVVAGATVPHLDDQSLSMLLFLAGTGLAAALLLSPFQSVMPDKRPAAASDAALRSRMPSATQLPARFSELMGRQHNPAFDRAEWAKLTAHMSHELRTPLNAVLGFSEMMSNEVFGPLGSNLYSSYARDIHSSGRLLLKSAEDALAITALLTATDRNGSCPAANIREIVEDAVAFADYDLRARSISITTDIGGHLDAAGEPQALRQALINLLAEAASNAGEGATILVVASRESDHVRLSIEVDHCGQDTAAAGNSFALMLARTLCELSGAKLTCPEYAGTNRAWTIDLVATAQTDLFV